MCTKIDYYKDTIIDMFRTGKISSITVNGYLYTDYKDFDPKMYIEDLKINKKYLKLFKDDEFVLDHFISNKELLVKNMSTGRYNKLKVLPHARNRFISRFIVLITKMPEMLNQSFVEQKDVYYALINIFFKELTPKELSSVSSFKNKLLKFIDEYIDIIDLEIYQMFKYSSKLKNVPKIYMKRIEKHGDTNYFVNNPFLLVYDIKTSSIKTIEIYNNLSNKNGEKTKKKQLNESVHDYTNVLSYLNKYLSMNRSRAQ